VTNGALPSLVLLSTDGYANSFRSDEDFLKIGQDYLEIIREQGISSLAEELPAILTEATQQGSGDDITLAILQDDLSAAGPTKVPRPLMTHASKSALIEQLKARHSSQQHKLQELAVSVEQTRRDNRRLRNTVLFLVAAVIAIVVAVFHSRIFPPSPRPPLPPATDPGTASRKPAATTARKPLNEEWTLQLKGKEIPLSKGSNIPATFVHPEAKSGEYPDEYAQVAWDPDKHAMVLINGSKDKWSASNGQKANANEEIKLGQKPFTILFTPKIKGTLGPAVEAATESAPKP
jgi:hypothetical protein